MNPNETTAAEDDLFNKDAPRPSPDWTRHLRPVNAPAPACAAPTPAAVETPTPPAPGGGTHSSSIAAINAEFKALRQGLPPAGVAGTATSTLSAPGETCAAGHDGQGPVPPTGSAPGFTREHPVPGDSILADYRDFVRGISELPDALIVAPVLALCGKLLTPNVTLNFGAQKPLTIYNYIATPAGLRKSTTFTPAEQIARKILMMDDFISGNASDSALFDTFENQPHRLQFEDEGNTILRSWETSAYGREASARYLRLYDGSSWSQNFRRECKSHEDGKAERSIPQATLSLCLGSTFGVARLSQLEAGCGLRRRFGFYVATEQARDIWWPETLEGAELDRLADLFHNLTLLQGSVGKASLTRDAMQYWIMLQKRNRKRCKEIPGYTSGDESLLSSLNESPMRCLKLAVIFQACRWARDRDSSIDPFLVTEDNLAMAEAHQDACLDALVYIEGVGKRTHVDDTAEWVLSQIAGDHLVDPAQRSDVYTRTELTRRFAANPGRPGALTASRLYGEVIPHLIAKGRCKQLPKMGKQVSYEITWD